MCYISSISYLIYKWAWSKECKRITHKVDKLLVTPIDVYLGQDMLVNQQWHMNSFLTSSCTNSHPEAPSNLSLWEGAGQVTPINVFPNGEGHTPWFNVPCWIVSILHNMYCYTLKFWGVRFLKEFFVKCWLTVYQYTISSGFPSLHPFANVSYFW
jgi:hypothetical protein